MDSLSLPFINQELGFEFLLNLAYSEILFLWTLIFKSAILYSWVNNYSLKDVYLKEKQMEMQASSAAASEEFLEFFLV